MAITLRSTKGIPLTHVELDNNFVDLNTRVTVLENTVDNDNQTLTLVGTNLSISNGNSVNLSTIIPVVPTNISEFNNDSGYINTYQTLSVAGTNLSISNGNTISLSALGFLTAEADTLDTVTGRGASTTNAISVGAVTATGLNLNSNAIALGTNASNNSAYGIAIGRDASTDGYGVAIGFDAAADSYAVSIGFNAGRNNITNDDTYTVAVGAFAAQNNQGSGAIAIGALAGDEGQGDNSIAIGRYAGRLNQHQKSIILNATNTDLNSTAQDAFYVKPVRSSTTSNVLYYNTITGEISYGAAASGGVDLTAFSVGTEGSPSGNGSLGYDNTTGVFTYTPPDLSSYLTSYTETDTLDSVTSRNAVTSNNITVGDINAQDITANSITADSMVFTGVGTVTITSGNNVVLNAANGAGTVSVSNSKIINLATPTANTDAATKAYVDNALTNQSFIGTATENLRVESGKISLNSSKSDSLYTDAGGSYTSASWSGNNIDFTGVEDIYLETLLERFDSYFAGSSSPWAAGYSNITVRINDTQTLTVTGASFSGGTNWRVEVAETPASDPTAVTSAEFLYDFVSTLELDRDDNSYAIALDDSNFRVNTRRDIRLESGDDIYIDGRSNMRLRNYSRTSGITIETDFNNEAYEWLFGEDGTLQAPGDIVVAGDITGTASASTLVLGAEPNSNTYIQLNDTVDSTINTVANLEIHTDVANTAKTWTFDINGDLSVPNYIQFKDSSFIGDEGGAGTPVFRIDAAAGQGISLTSDSGIENANHNWLFGADGNFTAPGNITVGSVLKIDDGVHEKVQNKVDAVGIVEHDCSQGHIFYHTSPDANWSVNLTNLNLESGYATTVTIIIDQGATGYYPTELRINGFAILINWQGNSTPTPSVNRTDVVSFSIINNSGTYTVLGQLTGF